MLENEFKLKSQIEPNLLKNLLKLWERPVLYSYSQCVIEPLGQAQDTYLPWRQQPIQLKAPACRS
jgi:hypothetical protein